VASGNSVRTKSDPPLQRRIGAGPYARLNSDSVRGPHVAAKRRYCGDGILGTPADHSPDREVPCRYGLNLQDLEATTGVVRIAMKPMASTSSATSPNS
jgi:hypothetical protein